MGQRVLPQRKREPLHTTQRLLWRARATIWASSETALFRFIRLFSQLSEKPAFALTDSVVSVMIKLDDGNVRFICVLHGKLAKPWHPTQSEGNLHSSPQERKRAKFQNPINPFGVTLQTVLFLCTHNSARSQMAEAFLNQLCGNKFKAESAGSTPTEINPYVTKVMAEIGVPLTNHRSKSVNEFQGRAFNYVVTVCDSARETCPFFPGEKEIHKPFPDPAVFTGTDKEILTKTRKVRDRIKEWISNVFCSGNPDDEAGLQGMQDLLK
jgi:arsenate reductase